MGHGGHVLSRDSSHGTTHRFHADAFSNRGFRAGAGVSPSGAVGIPSRDRACRPSGSKRPWGTWCLGLGLLLSVLVGAGCEADFGQDEAACWFDASCDSNQVCAFNYCVSPAPNALVVSARIIPPPSSGYVEQQLPMVELDGSFAIDVTLMEAVELRGGIGIEGHPFAGYNVPGDLEARTDGDLLGHDYRFTGRSLEGLNESGDGYTLRVLAGRDYAMQFRPDDRELPLHSWTLRAGDLQETPVQITLPAESYVHVTGFVRFSALKPVLGATVEGILADGTRVTTTTTDLSKGHFTLALPPGTSAVRFRIRPAGDGALFPTVLTGMLNVDDEIALWVEESTDAPIDARIQLLGGASGDPVPVAETTITLATASGDFRQSATTDATGRASFHLLPGDYQIAVCPNPGSPLASYSATLPFTAKAPHQEIALGERVHLEGNLRDHKGRPVGAGSVRLTRSAPLSDEEKPLVSPAPFNTLLDSAGAFAIDVDPGTYDLRFVPAAHTGAPPMTMSRVDIGWDERIDVILPPPDFLHIRVLNENEEPQSGVSIELYVGAPRKGLTQLLSLGVSDAFGHVPFLIPHLETTGTEQ